MIVSKWIQAFLFENMLSNELYGLRSVPLETGFDFLYWVSKKPDLK